MYSRSSPFDACKCVLIRRSIWAESTIRCKIERISVVLFQTFTSTNEQQIRCRPEVDAVDDLKKRVCLEGISSRGSTEIESSRSRTAILVLRKCRLEHVIVRWVSTILCIHTNAQNFCSNLQVSCNYVLEDCSNTW